MSYNYPEFNNNLIRETYDKPNALRVADGREVQYSQPSNKFIPNAVPDKYTPEGAYNVPGTQVFGTGKSWREMPQSQDIIHREYNIQIDQPLYYRSASGIRGRVDTAPVRVFPKSVTAPSINAARFLDGRNGDVYGR